MPLAFDFFDFTNVIGLNDFPIFVKLDRSPSCTAPARGGTGCGQTGKPSARATVPNPNAPQIAMKIEEAFMPFPPDRSGRPDRRNPLREGASRVREPTTTLPMRGPSPFYPDIPKMT